jgi:hypothetical protein
MPTRCHAIFEEWVVCVSEKSVHISGRVISHQPPTLLAAVPIFSLNQVKVKVKFTLRLTVSQSVSLTVEPHLELMTRYLLLFGSYGLVFLGRPL